MSGLVVYIGVLTVKGPCCNFHHNLTRRDNS